ncbi:hypothetical protein ACQEVB_10685 [Pseudonocardia sp. CA-107938]|uniref:hypothetical protein n=1 Tax=Pseudonocardia sp. CA-107938 TaxID=3240021 RepID=UPI003D8F3338
MHDWSELIDELIHLPGALPRLRAEHVDDGTGRCRECTTPGRGTPWVLHPCSLATLVRMADERIAELREEGR